MRSDLKNTQNKIPNVFKIKREKEDLIFTLARGDLHRNVMIIEFGSLEAAHAFDLYGYPHEAADLIEILTEVLAPLQITYFFAQEYLEMWERRKGVMSKVF